MRALADLRARWATRSASPRPAAEERTASDPGPGALRGAPSPGDTGAAAPDRAR
jgi:hypothetical protein